MIKVKFTRKQFDTVCDSLVSTKERYKKVLRDLGPDDVNRPTVESLLKDVDDTLTHLHDTYHDKK